MADEERFYVVTLIHTETIIVRVAPDVMLKGETYEQAAEVIALERNGETTDEETVVDAIIDITAIRRPTGTIEESEQ